MSQTTIKFAVYISFGFFLSLFICLLCLSSRWLVTCDEEMKIVNSMKYFERDYLHNDTSIGIVSLFEEIGGNGFLSYSDIHLRKQILISPFGTEEYECFGSCYCEEDRRSVSRSRTLAKGVSYLLAAVSSVLALNLAHGFFSEGCQEKFSNICESKSIRSEVEECEQVMKGKRDKGVGFEDDPIFEEREYFCYGNCVERYRTKFKERPDINCEKLKKEGSVVVKLEFSIGESSSTKNIFRKMAVIARKKFQREYLKIFCKENSEFEYIYEYTKGYNILQGGEKKISTKSQKRTGFFCSGLSHWKTTGSSETKNVKCRQSRPKSNSKNAIWQERAWLDEKKIWDKL